jgi:hypothetical protein
MLVYCRIVLLNGLLTGRPPRMTQRILQLYVALRSQLNDLRDLGKAVYSHSHSHALAVAIAIAIAVAIAVVLRVGVVCLHALRTATASGPGSGTKHAEGTERS